MEYQEARNNVSAKIATVSAGAEILAGISPEFAT
jgi:hypothetical protein